MSVISKYQAKSLWLLNCWNIKRMYR